MSLGQCGAHGGLRGVPVLDASKHFVNQVSLELVHADAARELDDVGIAYAIAGLAVDRVVARDAVAPCGAVAFGADALSREAGRRYGRLLRRLRRYPDPSARPRPVWIAAFTQGVA